MIEELHAEIDNWRAEYIHLGRELGKIIKKEVDEDGDVIESFDGYRNQELEDKLKLIEATFKKDEADYERYNSEKIKAMTKNLKMIESIVKMYGAQSEE